jgi:hypothetical protein
MKNEYENEHEMIGEGDTAEELPDGMEDDAAEQERAAEEKKKKDKQFKMMVFGVAGVGLLGVFGYKFISGSPEPKPSVVVNQPSNLAPAAPAPVAQGPSANLAQAPVAPATVVDTVAQSNPAVPVAINSAVPINPAAPAPAAGNPGATMIPEPTAVTPQLPEVKLTSEGFSRGFDELAKKLDDLKAMFTKFDEMNIGDRLAKLEARVSALEGKPSGARPIAGSSNTGAGKHRARVYETPTTKVVPIGEGEELLFARIDEPQRVQVPTAYVAVEAAKVAPAQSTRGYALSAVIPGRIWVKGGDGSSQTFEAGEVLPDGAKILKIDPDRGDVTTSKGVLKFEQR